MITVFERADSLIILLSKAKEDTTRVNLLSQLSGIIISLIRIQHIYLRRKDINLHNRLVIQKAKCIVKKTLRYSGGL